MEWKNDSIIIVNWGPTALLLQPCRQGQKCGMTNGKSCTHTYIVVSHTWQACMMIGSLVHDIAKEEEAHIYTQAEDQYGSLEFTVELCVVRWVEVVRLSGSQ